MTFYQKQLQLF